MTTLSLSKSAQAHRAYVRLHGSGTSDLLVEELIQRWDGCGAPETVLRKAARCHKGFASLHGMIRQDRDFVASAAWLFAFVASLAVIVLASGLVELLILDAGLQRRMIVTAALLGLAALGLSRRRCRLPVIAAVLAACTVLVILLPASASGVATWDLQAALLAWTMVATKAVRLHFDTALDRAEARLLLLAAGCRV